MSCPPASARNAAPPPCSTNRPNPRASRASESSSRRSRSAPPTSGSAPPPRRSPTSCRWPPTRTATASRGAALRGLPRQTKLIPVCSCTWGNSGSIGGCFGSATASSSWPWVTRTPPCSVSYIPTVENQQSLLRRSAAVRFVESSRASLRSVLGKIASVQSASNREAPTIVAGIVARLNVVLIASTPEKSAPLISQPDKFAKPRFA